MARSSQQLNRRRRGSRLVLCILVVLRQQRANAFQASSPLFSTRRVVSSQSSRGDVSAHERTAAVVTDPSIAIQPVRVEYNDQRYSASDWWHNMISLRNSTVLREIKAPVSAIVVWSAFVSIVDLLLLKTNTRFHITLSSKPHSLLVSSLGLLLVFRTNSAYQRFAVRPSRICSMERLSKVLRRTHVPNMLSSHLMLFYFIGRTQDLGKDSFCIEKHESHGNLIQGRTRNCWSQSHS